MSQKKDKNTETTQMMSLGTVKESKHPALLTIIMGPHQWIGKFWSVKSHHTFGRDSSQVSIYIPNNTLSRKHLELEYISAEKIQVRDLDSTNGSFLNDEPMKPHQFYTLQNNDILRMGDIVFKYVASGNIEAHSIFKSRDDIYTDSLCQIYNRKYMDDKGQELLLNCQKKKSPLSFVIFDIDHFKKINDQYCHMGGDFILSCVSSLVQRSIRKTDVFCRIGGEEFSLMFECDLEEALQLMEQIREKIEQEKFEFEDQSVRVTVSAGLTAVQSGDTSWKTMYERADALLYEAKKTGRNKICS